MAEAPEGGAARRWIPPVAALTAAALAGASGLALEVLYLSAAAPVLGQGRAAPFGLGAWVAGWALGAWCAGRWSLGRRAVPVVLASGALAALLGGGGVGWLARDPAGVPALAAGLAILATAAAQGGLLVPLARAAGVRGLWAANLVGAAVGARLAAWELPAWSGREDAAWVAAGAAVAAALAGALALRGTPAMLAPPEPTRRLRPRPGIALAAGLGTFAMVVYQGAGVRLAAVWLGGHQAAAAAVLVASLIALAAGAVLLAPLLPRGPRGVAAVLGLSALGSLFLLRGPGPLLELGGPVAGSRPPGLLVALLAVGPALAPLGALVPALVRALRADALGVGAPAALGGLLLHEAWGGLAAALAFPWLLVPGLGLAGAIGAGTGALALAAIAVAPRPRIARGPLPAVGALAAVVALATATRPSPVLAAPAIANPAFERLSFAEGPDFAVTIVHDGIRDERTVLTDDFRATATGDDYLYMRALGHVPVLLHPAPRRVGVLALGTGTTVGAVALHPEVERIDVFELSRAVVAAAPHFEDVSGGALAEGLPGLLDDGDGVARVVVQLGDGRRRLREFRGVLDVLTMEPLLPDAPAAVHLYTEGFYREAHAALAPGGLLCQWVPPHALSPPVFDAVLAAFRRAHGWSAVFLSGTQVLLVGAEACPTLTAERFAPSRLGAAGPALAELGLDSPGGVAARLVTAGAAAPAAARPLTDADPWIVYRTRPHGSDALAFLPQNLARLGASVSPLPDGWRAAVGEAGLVRRATLRQLHTVRQAWSADRARRAGLALTSLARDAGALRRKLDGGPFEDDPEVRQLDRQVRYEFSRDRGLDLLLAGDARAALDTLALAAELRPGRADAHLYIAAAAGRLGMGELSARALARAVERCPGALETPQGRLALELGLGRALAGR